VARVLRRFFCWGACECAYRFRLTRPTPRLHDVTGRRFVALALAASMLHLSSVRADSACATHGEHSKGSAQMHHDDADSHSSHSPGPGDSKDKSCETPSQPDCCQALASCSVALGFDGGARLAQHELAHAGVLAALTTAPLSRIATPDPPPPRL
jgi:hypothetical protein